MLEPARGAALQPSVADGDSEDQRQEVTMLPRPPATWGTSPLRLPLPCALGPAAVALGVGILQATGRRAGGTVYSVAQLEARLGHQPEKWLGQAVRLRAIAEPCLMWGDPSSGMHCLGSQPVLVDRADSLAAALPLAWRPQGPLLAVLRGMPLVGELVPAPRVVDWEAPATYRVQLRALDDATCGTRCYEGVLLDAAPDGPGEG
jgi:hypothetical protein